jgi:hypothetical protein
VSPPDHAIVWDMSGPLICSDMQPVGRTSPAGFTWATTRPLGEQWYFVLTIILSFMRGLLRGRLFRSRLRRFLAPPQRFLARSPLLCSEVRLRQRF